MTVSCSRMGWGLGNGKMRKLDLQRTRNHLLQQQSSHCVPRVTAEAARLRLKNHPYAEKPAEEPSDATVSTMRRRRRRSRLSRLCCGCCARRLLPRRSHDTVTSPARRLLYFFLGDVHLLHMSIFTLFTRSIFTFLIYRPTTATNLQHLA